MSRTVVIVGGGYAGVTVAASLDAVADVVLVDPRDAFVNVAACLRAAVRREWAPKPFFDYGTLLERGRIVRGTVASADGGGVTLATGQRIEADYLVLCTGSSHAHPAHPRAGASSAEDAIGDLRATHDQLSRAGRVLIAGELEAITVVDRSGELLPGFLPEIREQLRDQLDELGIDVRLGTSLAAEPSTPVATSETFTVTAATGESITADIWFRAFGSCVNTSYLRDGALVTLTERHTVPVDGHLNVVGHRHVYALGDIADLPDAKQATHAQTQAPVVADNIGAQLDGQPPASVYEPAGVPRILMPLGSRGGVGQLPGPDGRAVPTTAQAVVQRKGADLFTTRFAERFSRSG